MDRLRSMRIFERVVDQGGFAAAARALDMSAPMVTRMVSDLERHLDTRLLQRTNRRVALTDAGRTYLERVREILGAIDEAESCARGQTDEIAGPLRIHVRPVIPVRVLAPLVAEFRRLHPRVVLDITVDNSENLAVEDYDLTLLGTDSKYDADVVARPVITTEVLLCAAPSYLRNAPELREPSDLRHHACLRPRYPGARLRDWTLVNPQAADQRVTIEVAPALITNDVGTLMRAALDGAGISAHPVAPIVQHLQSGALQRVLAPWICGRVTVYAALPSRKYVPARTRAFLDFLIEQTRLRAEAAERACASLVQGGAEPRKRGGARSR